MVNVSFTYENFDDEARVITILPSASASNTKSLTNTLSLPYVVSAIVPAKGSGVNIKTVRFRMSAE